MDQVIRFNLKTDCKDRARLLEYCLNGRKQFLAIGWSYIYKEIENKETKKIEKFQEFYDAVKEVVPRINHVFNVFLEVKKDDLFWTRDLDGYYWICRAIGEPKIKCDYDMDIGALLPIVAYKVGMDVPGQIKASFNRPNGGIAGKIKDNIIIEYSKYMYNLFSKTEKYDYKKIEGSILDNLPDFELEEMVIAYLQLEKNYYVLSNSIAKKSTTINIECEFRSRDKNNEQKAVLQVKGGKDSTINAMDYKTYIDDGYIVYLYGPIIENINLVENCCEINRADLIKFYEEYKLILPESITIWEDLFI
ncbi:MAG: ribonuclease D [Peptoanaerobacter stomatis]|uniref:ribonuclease D n=1 Tax=Peptoanaerobacter stomatis TaxID=796937 RepID=UPI003FA178BA